MQKLIAALAIAVAVPASAAELVVNPGFETGSFAGWTRYGAAGSTSVGTASPHGGTYASSWSPNRSGGIYQDIPTQPGGTYAISFWLSHAVATATPLNSFSVSIDDTVLDSMTNVGALSYTQYSFEWEATGTTARLSFDFRDARPTVFRLDDVSMTLVPAAQPVPEPGTWLMLIAGFGAIGAAARRRNLATGA